MRIRVTEDSDNKCRLTAVDLFCGSGAVTEALRRQGYRVLVAVDNDPIACRTYKQNHYRTRVICDDIDKVDPATHSKFVGVGAVDLLIVCAPCQPFSSQNRAHKDALIADDRARLLLQCVKFARSLKPKVLLFENVSGLAALHNQVLLQQLKSELADEGYLLSEPRRVDAADLGVPQRRVRCVMVAGRSPEAIGHFEKAVLRPASMTVKEAIGHLPALNSGERSETDELHFARTHQDVVLERLRYISKNGGSRSDLPKRLELACHEGRTKSFSDVYGRMRWDDVAPTLTTGCTDVTKGRYAHPEQDRAITLREAALLQTFPPEYRFHGNTAQIARQIGNAVPVRMLEALMPVVTTMIRPPA
ncbi:MAG: DNA (cytosine-5)-methyltransferase 1 [Brevundimonas sp.]|jgi:DNA (cytosine-5)-methyltransferase 1|uniref:DNA cytosine methyltransferase n=1 Tax=Brevundimonas sp. TaxID=1871086 RepID=UPI0039E6B2BD